MIEDARGIVVATTHEALGDAMETAGATRAGSIGTVSEAVYSGAATGVLASQEFPGLTPTVVRGWGSEGVPVLLWLEGSPPPSWQGVAPGVEEVAGEIADEDINAWLRGTRDGPDFTEGAHRLGVLGLGLPVSELAALWATRLSRIRGPGLVVDADWSGAALTERLAPHVWTRIWDYRAGRTLPIATGHLMPAPPPWEGPADEGFSPDVPVGAPRTTSWMLVDLGSDFRRRPGLMWIPRLEALALDASNTSADRVRETVRALRSLHPALILGCRGLERGRVDSVASLGKSWPRENRATSAGPRGSGVLQSLVARMFPRS